MLLQIIIPGIVNALRQKVEGNNLSPFYVHKQVRVPLLMRLNNMSYRAWYTSFVYCCRYIYFTDEFFQFFHIRIDVFINQTCKHVGVLGWPAQYFQLLSFSFSKESWCEVASSEGMKTKERYTVRLGMLSMISAILLILINLRLFPAP